MRTTRFRLTVNMMALGPAIFLVTNASAQFLRCLSQKGLKGGGESVHCLKRGGRRAGPGRPAPQPVARLDILD
jgi:hypothetical protein